MITRWCQELEQFLKPGKVLAIYGARQVGKTTLLREFLERTALRYRLDSGDDVRLREALSHEDFQTILEYVEGYDLIAIDEAQRVPNVGRALKIMVDQVPGLRVIVTGSSSFELAGQMGEPLTGRKRTLRLYPIAQLELAAQLNRHELKAALAERLVYGAYPEVVTASTMREKRDIIEEVAHAYVLKDILEFNRVRGAKPLVDLLRLIAFQVGSEVSHHELGKQLGIDHKTVHRYLDLLEKAFVLIPLHGFSRNLRKEITKKSKYYFLDLGIRNALISNFNALELRDDLGALWENFLVVERIKAQVANGISANNYFWRTYGQHEVDWIEERGGKLHAYEFKRSDAKPAKGSKVFLDTYPEAELQVIHQGNYLDFVT